ncbi:DNA-binding response regulator [Sesbania bispinosa]|nr:DNA-binding response regulator [Sesbania bispinosa]
MSQSNNDLVQDEVSDGLDAQETTYEDQPDITPHEPDPPAHLHADIRRSARQAIHPTT